MRGEGVARVTVQTPRSTQRAFLSVRSLLHDPGISSDRGAFVVCGKRMIRSVERRALLMMRRMSSDAASPPRDQWLGRFSVPVIPATQFVLVGVNKTPDRVTTLSLQAELGRFDLYKPKRVVSITTHDGHNIKRRCIIVRCAGFLCIMRTVYMPLDP